VTSRWPGDPWSLPDRLQQDLTTVESRSPNKFLETLLRTLRKGDLGSVVETSGHCLKSSCVVERWAAVNFEFVAQALQNNTITTMTTSFEVYVRKDDFKFHAAHFVAYKGYRERLHGHNYKVGVRVLGSQRIASDGYVVDFGNIKKATRKVCKELNERFLCPTLSDAIEITSTVASEYGGKEMVTLKCEDGSVFSFPRDDCAMLPIVHATTEVRPTMVGMEFGCWPISLTLSSCCCTSSFHEGIGHLFVEPDIGRLER
jgi:dihydroneopterin triphosphate aldolase (PTPS-III) / 6-pyruvoyltetrahydropterin synthase